MSQSNEEPSRPFSIVFGLVTYGIIFGGGHLYLAWRGEETIIPVSSRWRFLSALAIWLALAAIATLGPNGTLFVMTVDILLAGAGIVVLLGYWVSEARDGYRDSRRS